MNTIKILINKIIYHPVRSRVLYDFSISFFVLCFMYSSFAISLGTSLPFFIIIIFPVLFVGGNFFLGLYGKHKMDSPTVKALIISISSLASAFLLYIISPVFLLPFFLSVFFTIVITSMSRYFLNFHIKQNKNLQPVILDNAPILVVGGGGYIGTWLTQKLLEKNYKVRVFDTFLYGKDMFKKMKNNKNLELVEGNIADIYSLTQAVKDVSAVVHLAGIVGDPAGMVDEKLTRQINVVATRMLKETVKSFRIPRFIFASTCAVYGAPKKTVTEESSVNPMSLYAQTKLDAEKELLEDTFDDFHPTILRFTTVFGHSPKMRFDLAVNLFTAKAYYQEPLMLIGDGLQWRPFIYVGDIADAIIKVLEAPLEKVSRQIFNVGDDTEHLQIKNVIALVKKISEKKITIIKKQQASDRGNYRVSFKKIKQQLDFHASVSVENGIKEMFRNLKKGRYALPFSDPYYSSTEGAKTMKKEFYAKKKLRLKRLKKTKRSS